MDDRPEPEPAFETDLQSLEKVVDDLERGELALSVALARYEEGVRLLARCHNLLDRAERSVGLLTGVDDHGTPVTTPFDATASTLPDSPPPGVNIHPGSTFPRKRRTKPPEDENDRLIPF